jgi:hypothetical protein
MDIQSPKQTDKLFSFSRDEAYVCLSVTPTLDSDTSTFKKGPDTLTCVYR